MSIPLFSLYHCCKVIFTSSKGALEAFNLNKVPDSLLVEVPNGKYHYYSHL
jgi:hypothetical protein